MVRGWSRGAALLGLPALLVLQLISPASATAAPAGNQQAAGGSAAEASLAESTISRGVAPSVAGAATASCPLTFVGVRGSGETQNSAGGFGDTIDAVRKQVQALVPTASARAIDYPAISIPAARLQDVTYSLRYANSISDGRKQLAAFLRDWYGRCGTSGWLVLAGYSQGAHVVGDVMTENSWVSSAVRARVAGVVLIGDPRFRGDAVYGVGDFDRRLNGVATGVYASRAVSLSGAPPLRSYCQQGDAVCNISASNLKFCLQGGTKSACPHSHYMDWYYGPEKVTYTTSAGSYLARSFVLARGVPTVNVGPALVAPYLPRCPNPGFATSFIITAEHFAANEEYTVQIGPLAWLGAPGPTADALGSFTFKERLEALPSGVWSVEVQGNKGSSARSTLRVGHDACIDRVVTDEGTSLRYQGGGWGSEDELLLYLDGEPVATADADSFGSFETDAVVPCPFPGGHTASIQSASGRSLSVDTSC